MSVAPQRVERIIDASGVCERIERLLPIGVRPRQLRVRTLLLGMTIAMLDGREALLRNIHKTLTELPADQQHRLGVIAPWQHGPHLLTYRQLEYTFRVIVAALAKPTHDGSPSETLSEILDRLLEASVTVLGEPDSSSYAVDWTDQQTWSRPPPKHPARAEHADHHHDQTPSEACQHPDPADAEHPAAEPHARCADPEASWGHRTANHPSDNEMFYGYYLQAVTIVKDQHGPEVPELVRRIQLAACAHDPPRALVPVLGRMVQGRIPIGDLLADSGYSYRVAEHWALPVRQLGAQPIHDLHPTTAAPTAPTTARSAQTGTSTAPPPRPRYSNSHRSHAPRAPNKPPRTTSTATNSPATSSHQSPATTPTATTASAAPPPKASSAAHAALSR